MFKGSIVAMVTPFKDNAIDFKGVFTLIDMHLQAGTHALVIAGTTGEGGLLTILEQQTLLQQVVHYVKGAVPVIAGASANATQTCVQLATQAMNCGADALLIMTPAYIKPTQEGLYQHYATIATQVKLPIILYNVPSRTACDLLPETVARLTNFANIIGIKDATGKLSRLQELLTLCGDRIKVYSGDDLTAAEWLLAGATGVISVTANIMPRAIVELYQLAQQQNTAKTLHKQSQLMPLHQALFVESNPIPVKWALHQMGLIHNELRLPLTPLSAQHHAPLQSLL